VVDNADGTYTITLTAPTESGTADITVIVAGVTEPLTASVVFDKEVVFDPFIPEGFSPDGDGVNDTFDIEDAEGFRITFQVFNRWGNLVYESTDYQNTFDGIANRGVVLGQQLPDGTYFYVVNPNDSSKPLTRYFTIKRQ